MVEIVRAWHRRNEVEIGSFCLIIGMGLGLVGGLSILPSSRNEQNHDQTPLLPFRYFANISLTKDGKSACCRSAFFLSSS